jgi:hypothetical protein
VLIGAAGAVAQGKCRGSAKALDPRYGLLATFFYGQHEETPSGHLMESEPRA